MWGKDLKQVRQVFSPVRNALLKCAAPGVLFLSYSINVYFVFALGYVNLDDDDDIPFSLS